MPTLIANLVRRPKVETRIGEPIDVRELMNIGPTTEPTDDEVRLAADVVMGRLVAVVAELRGEPAPTLTASTASPTDSAMSVRSRPRLRGAGLRTRTGSRVVS